MGALKDLYQTISEELGKGEASHSEAAFTEKLRRDTVRHHVSKALFELERTLLLNPQQKGALFPTREEDAKAPFDELELIVKNNVFVKNHIGAVKECITDLDELSTTGDPEETAALHRDELSQKVLNMLHAQTAQVLLLTDKDENGQASHFVKQPKAFLQGVMIAADRDRDAFDEVHFDKDLSTVDLDCKEYLRKSRPNPKWNAIREEDENFNKDALKLRKDIDRLEADAFLLSGKAGEDAERKRMQAEKILAKATQARTSAIRDAFRTGDISEYYYKQRTEQLEKREYTHVPEIFEVDALKNREQYLKDHDLQDLSKSERNAICALALKRAQKEKEIYLKKQFLSKKGLDHSDRYMISEMALRKDIFYRGLSEGSGLCEEVTDDGSCRISVDLDEIGEDYIGMTMRQVASPREKERSVKK